MFRRRNPPSGPAEQGAAASPVRLPVPSRESVAAVLTEFGLTYHVDEDGDLVAPWEKGNVFFFFYGERKEVMQARLYLHRRFEVEARPALALVLDEWNRTRLSPKAYTVLPDDGLVGVCAEQCHDFELGANDDQLRYAVGQWVDSLLRFAEWLDEQV